MGIPVLLCGKKPFVYLKRNREVVVDPGSHFDPGMGRPMEIASAGDQQGTRTGKFQRVGLLLVGKFARFLIWNAVVGLF